MNLRRSLRAAAVTSAALCVLLTGCSADKSRSASDSSQPVATEHKEDRAMPAEPATPSTAQPLENKVSPCDLLTRKQLNDTVTDANFGAGKEEPEHSVALGMDMDYRPRLCRFQDPLTGNTVSIATKVGKATTKCMYKDCSKQDYTAMVGTHNRELVVIPLNSAEEDYVIGADWSTLYLYPTTTRGACVSCTDNTVAVDYFFPTKNGKNYLVTIEVMGANTDRVLKLMKIAAHTEALHKAASSS